MVFWYNKPMKKIEKFLINEIFPDLERGRANFDKPHTVAVVYWLKQILKRNSELNLDETVLLIAAYAHDWGYADLFAKGQKLKYDDVKNAKVTHMEVGAEKVNELLKNEVFSSLTDKQKARCIHLVRVHDKLDNLKDSDELVLMEADTLGGLDISRVEPTFNVESNNKYIFEVKRRRVPRFITEFGKETVGMLVQKRAEHYNKKILSK